ncbi:MAG TPA: YraN family protein [Thermoanaerobaculia bacterium]|nr:YraN family protein [Thermoanaerobaculia bacterium]
MRQLPGFDDGAHERGKGAAAEEVAAHWLERQGFLVLDRNFHRAGGEVDLIAREDETLCFIEIKARGSQDFGSGLEAVDERKQQRIARAALAYLVRFREPPACRFDVLSLERGAEGWTFDLIRDAFQL